MPEFYMIFARKINKIPECYITKCPSFTRSLPEKIVFARIWGGGGVAPVSYAYGSRGGALVGAWEKSPQKPDIGYADSLQLSNAFLRRFVAESILHLPLPQKTSDLRESHDPTRDGRIRVGTCPRRQRGNASLKITFVSS